jgi:hypothetical protein
MGFTVLASDRRKLSKSDSKVCWEANVLLAD